MANYQRLYTMLFNAITDAIEQLDEGYYGPAEEILIRAQLDAEEQYIFTECEENGEW